MSRKKVKREINDEEYKALYKIQFGWTPIGWRFILYGDKEATYKISVKKILCNINTKEFTDLYIWLLLYNKKKWCYMDSKYISI